MITFLIIICILLFIAWCCAPGITDLEADFRKFAKIYPNKYKQLIVIFLHGPVVIVVFGCSWIKTNTFKHSTTILSFQQWLRK